MNYICVMLAFAACRHLEFLGWGRGSDSQRSAPLALSEEQGQGAPKSRGRNHVLGIISEADVAVFAQKV
jgi:hypothetical protein